MANIVILSRRNITHPAAGGASVYLHEIFRRLTSHHRITVLSQGSKDSELLQTIDGIDYVNVRNYFVRALLPLRYLTRFSKNADLLIDHGDVALPWLSPLYSRTPKITIIHQLVKEIFYYELGRPSADLGVLLERMIYKAYGRSSIVAVSRSTAADLYRLGIPRDLVYVIPPGCSTGGPNIPIGGRQNTRIICVARLMRYKGLESALAVFRSVLDKFPSAVLEVAGSGPYETQLREAVNALGLSGQVRFLGKVSDSEKIKLYQESRMMLYPSVREGYGIGVIEANSFGTPVVGWDVPGLKDSIIDGSTGLLAPFLDKAALAAHVLTLLTDDETWGRLSENAWRWAHNHSWDAAAKRFETLIDGILGKNGFQIA